MPKVSIDQLQNIVLEGGGAKGAVYVGAIQAIEEKLKQHYKSQSLLTQLDAEAILDYGQTVDDKFVPQVKAFAGSSAGAITSLALALGLSAEQIKEVSNYPFTNFLQDTDPGKYRMIGQTRGICIGEDRRKFLGRGDGVAPYKFSLAAKQKIKPSFVKAQVRKKVLQAVTKSVVSGAYDTLEDYVELLQKAWEAVQTGGQSVLDAIPIDFDSLAVRIIKVLANIGAPASLSKLGFQGIQNAGTPGPLFKKQGAPSASKPALVAALWSKGWNWFIKHFLAHQTPPMNMEAVGCILWDGGGFSGFAVREFFFDLIIYASVNNTHFHRTYFAELEQPELRKVKLSVKDGRLKANFSTLPARLREKLEKLGSITFEEFYSATGIDLILCVSNFTTDEPLYFSRYWSPQFPVLEAVGASMSIPPAIRPVFNDSNVLPVSAMADKRYELDPKKMGMRNGRKEDYFDFVKYNVEVVAIKRFIASWFGISIGDNNPVGVSGFLTLLRLILAEMEERPGGGFDVDANDEIIRLDYDLLAYHYNAAYKGLLLDGGYRCNIPYNAFRTSVLTMEQMNAPVDPALKHTLALKLDDTYPKDWIAAIYAKLASAAEKMGSPKYLSRKEESILGKLLRLHFRTLFTKVRSRSQKSLFTNEDVKDLDDECYKRIATDVVRLYREMTKRHKTPWNNTKSIVMTAMEGYAYGSEEGQLRFISDHENILPLYSYGVGTFDFDLGKIDGLVKLSQKKAAEEVRNYFKAD